MSMNIGELSAGLYEGGKTRGAKHRFVLTDFDGGTDIDPKTKKPAMVFALQVDMEPQDGETDPFTETMSGGTGLVPTKDGKGFEQAPGAKKKGISKNSKAGKYIASLLKPVDDPTHGIDPAALGDDISTLDGIVYNLSRIEYEGFQGKGQKAGGIVAVAAAANPEKKTGGKTSALIVTEIFQMPGQKAAPAKAKAKPAPAAAEPEADEPEASDLGARVIEVIKQALAVAPGKKLTVQAASKKVFAAFKGLPEQTEASTLSSQDDFLGGDDTPWAYDDGDSTLTLM